MPHSFAVIGDTQFLPGYCVLLGNTDAYLHAHLFPRHEWEPPQASSTHVIGTPSRA